MITRQQLEVINRKTLQYPLHIAEKDYFLALVLQIISESSIGQKLIFKGGTALNHCYLEQHRFSEDLDFSANQKTIRLEDIRNIFTNTKYLKIKKDYLSGATVKIEKLQYIGPLIQPNSLKVEIDFLQNVLLPPKIMKYNNVWGIDLNIKVMDEREICAEKIRAMSERARYRDYYDLYLLFEKYQPDFAEIIKFIKRKEIRKPITLANIINNWKFLEEQKEMEIDRIFYSRKVEPKKIEDMVRSLPFMRID
ncbi:MAG: nucleotidyl transferase AbiEii/AbiGii toxin family protein [Candidatus Gracilibacteria bacterium]|jgi:predicted nucleotidyltransferase component of viral defense system